MSVVLRCPSCGTTRATPGECEACHEAKVRYFCTNHTPGVWVDTPSCPQCGARFGEGRRPPPAPAPPMRTRPPAPPPAPASPPAFRPRVEPPRARDESELREDLPPARDEKPAPAGSALAMLLNILNAGRSRPTPHPPRPAPRRGRGVGGCALRLVALLFAFAASLFFFGP